MSQTETLNVFSTIVQPFFNVIFTMLGSEFFWVCIIVLMGIGRWLLLRETLLFAGKKDINLTLLEKRKRRRMLFFGRGLLCVGLPFIMIFIMLSLLAAII